ncbi:DUF5686 and carboxypeptidase-like regulatory domain-containing protein [Botryobacter ruber]|uniref:DUF5686 and carboxypeptidase-like regulatory domain-containing protein n=1 Tax=Botryobacter ruber TaxID=2171629 RepID=UPI000E09F30F|nr:DUF5686 and carboxypeptidase-like regulatory domain-containing protein [Botryobacter ruber]
MPHRFRFYFLLLFICCGTFSAAGQVLTISGTVSDALTSEKLPFVNVVVNDGETGTTTDLDGQYQLRHNQPIRSVRFSYVGYATQVIYPDSATTINIQLQPVAARLSEVVVRRGENPAHRIIRLATQNRQRHRPENIPSYTYRTYNKFVFTAVGREEIDMSDTLSLTRQDSAYLKMHSLLAKQHLFLMESVTDYAYLKPDNFKETILATRVSGLQQPSFGIVAAEARAFSVYEDLPVFFGKRYLSPLSPGSTRRYDFLLEETSVIGNDTVFIISFKPEAGRNFDGLKGVLYINSNGWAVQNVLAESATDADKRGLKLQQQFELVDGKQWFPKELDVELTVPQIRLKGHQPYGHLRTYITNVQLNPPLQRRDFGIIALKLAPDAHRQPPSFWQQYRPDTLNALERRTYHQLDSVGKEAKLDRNIRIAEYLTAQQIPVGKLSLDINRFVRLSDFEGLRLGIGAHTNKRFSERLLLGGYWGYGFGDKKAKYGADAGYVLHAPSELTLGGEYFKDVLEPGGRRLPFRPRPSLTNFRPAVLFQLDYATHQSVSLSGRLFRYLQYKTSLRREHRLTTLDLVPNHPQAYNTTEAVIGMRYAYGEQLMQMFNQTLPITASYPVLWLQYARGIDGLLNGGHSYHRYDVRLEAPFQHRTTGETSLALVAGLVNGDLPLLGLYNGYGSYSRDYYIYASEGFETMRPYEFFSDRYAALFLRQNLAKRLFRTNFFKPNVILMTNIGYGSLDHARLNLFEEQVQEMNKGFYESGLLLNDIIGSAFSGIGVGFFYRYGYYGFGSFHENLKIKITLSTAF